MSLRPGSNSSSWRATVWPTVRRGFSDAYGFWKTYWISLRAASERLRAAGGSGVSRSTTSPV